MCHRQLIQKKPIEAHQQVAAYLLIDGMAPIANRLLGYLSEQRVHEPEEQMLQRTDGGDEVARHSDGIPVLIC
jgi:hypothetical protein